MSGQRVAEQGRFVSRCHRVSWQGVDHTGATAKPQIGLTTVEVTITVAAAGASPTWFSRGGPIRRHIRS